MTKTKDTKVVRQCTSCTKGLTKDQIVYTSTYPERVPTRTGSTRPGTALDAERVWCSADCATATYDLAQLQETS